MTEVQSAYTRVGSGVARTVRMMCECCQQVFDVPDRRSRLCGPCRSHHILMAARRAHRKAKA